MIANNRLIEISMEPPKEPEERLIQLAFAIANITHEVLHEMEVNQRAHPSGAVRMVQPSPLIGTGARPQGPKGTERVELVAVLIPIELAKEIKSQALLTVQERREREREADGKAN